MVGGREKKKGSIVVDLLTKMLQVRERGRGERERKRERERERKGEREGGREKGRETERSGMWERKRKGVCVLHFSASIYTIFAEPARNF